MNITGQQQSVVDAIFNGNNCVAVARAATGKTSTIAELTRQVRTRAPGVRSLYVVFNKAMACDVAGKLAPGVDVVTAHALAMRHTGMRYAWRINTRPEVAPFMVAPRLGFRKPGIEFALQDGTSTFVKPAACAKLAMDTVRRYCYSADSLLGEGHVAMPRGIRRQDNPDATGRILTAAERLWRDAMRVDANVYKYQHDYYMKMFGLWVQANSIDLGYHLVILDEGQDASPIITQVVSSQASARRLVVGDPAQAIYGWRGARDALPGLVRAGYKELRLTQSFRFGTRIAELANCWLAAGGHKADLVGWSAIPSRVARVDRQQPHAVLCRTNTGCVEALVMELLEGQESVGIVGGMSNAAALISDVLALKEGRSTKHPSLDIFPDWKTFVSCLEAKLVDDPELHLARRLVSDHGAAIVPLLERAANVTDPKVTISTAHGAKGLEFDRVVVGGDFDGYPDDDDTEGFNLRYVAATRARLVLEPGPLADVPGWDRPWRQQVW